MSNVRVVTDSSCDLTKDVAKEYGIEVVPLQVLIDGVTYIDGQTLTAEEFHQKMQASKALPKTSQPTPGDFATAFRNAIKRGEEALCITLSSKLSGTHQSALLARSMVEEAKVAVVDSLTGTLALGLMAVRAAEMAAEGLSLKELVAWMEAAKRDFGVLVCLDTLDNAIKGGRISRVQGTIANALNYKVLLDTADGVVRVLEKVRGKKRVVNRMIELLLERGKDLSEKVVGISHVDNLAGALELKELILEATPVRKVFITPMGAAIGTYAGTGGLVLAYS